MSLLRRVLEVYAKLLLNLWKKQNHVMSLWQLLIIFKSAVQWVHGTETLWLMVCKNSFWKSLSLLRVGLPRSTTSNLRFSVTAPLVNTSIKVYIVAMVITNLIIFLCPCVCGNNTKYTVVRASVLIFLIWTGILPHDFYALFQHHYSLWCFARGAWFLL